MGIIFLICSLAYKILEYDIIRIETKETINLENGNLVSSDNTQKLKQNRHVTKSKRYNNLRRAFIEKKNICSLLVEPPFFVKPKSKSQHVVYM